MGEGFFSRWSQRKVAVREGKGVEEPVADAGAGAGAGAPLPPPATPSKGQGLSTGAPQPSPGGGGSDTADGPAPSSFLAGDGLTSSSPALREGLPSSPPPLGEGQGGGAPAPAQAQAGGTPAPAAPPTLEDAQSLTPASDFTRFVRPGVAPEVKNAALKKLFADPHFNVMDRLDVYIDDYNKPDPMPPSMLRQLASAKFLGFFADEERAQEGGNVPAASASADAPAAESVAQSGTRTAQALPPAEDHADPDLRLQQDDAPGPEGPGAGSR